MQQGLIHRWIVAQTQNTPNMSQSALGGEYRKGLIAIQAKPVQTFPLIQHIGRCQKKAPNRMMQNSTYDDLHFLKVHLFLKVHFF